MFAEKALISDDGYTSPLSVHGVVYKNLVTTASVYNQIPESFVGIKREFDDEEEEDEPSYEEYEENNVEGVIPEENEYFEEDDNQNNYLEEAINYNEAFE